MTKDDIVNWAHKAGFLIDTHAQQYQPNCILSTYGLIDENLERFANLVAAAERTAMMERSRTIIVQSEERGAAAERETIAQLFDAIPELVMPARRDDGVCIICGFSPKTAAKAIRARGNK